MLAVSGGAEIRISSEIMTDDFLKLLQQCPLHRRSPFLIRSVSTSYFSVARHYGGAKIQGCDYTYLPETDEIVRDDVLQWIQKQVKSTQKKDDPEQTKKDNQRRLFDDCDNNTEAE